MKKKRKLLIFTIILAIYVLGIGSYIVYDKLEVRKQTNENNKNNIKDVIESVSETIVEPIQEVLQSNNVDDTLNEAIKTSLIVNIATDETVGLTRNSNTFYAEGHNVLKTENTEDGIVVYLTAIIKTFVIKNGEYINTSSIYNPIKITFNKSYEFVSFEMPNSEDWENSLKEIFPSDLVTSASSVDYRIDFYEDQIKNYLNEE
jgi:hypothetical protein